MRKHPSMSLSNRRLITVAAIGALLAALLLVQLPWLHAVRANSQTAIARPPCNSADISAGESWSQPEEMTVILTASSTGCLSPVYKFWLLAPGSSTWVAQTGYTTSIYFDWTITKAKVGIWQIGVWARDTASTARYQAFSFRTYTLVSNYCTAAALSASPASPQPAASQVVFTATATGCGNPFFEFWVLSPGSSTWVMKQVYASANGPGGVQYTWISGPPGAYRIGVWARQWRSPRSYDTYAQMMFWIVA